MASSCIPYQPYGLQGDWVTFWGYTVGERHSLGQEARLSDFLSNQTFKILMQSNLSVYSFVDCTFGVVPKKCLPISRPQRHFCLRVIKLSGKLNKRM